MNLETVRAAKMGDQKSLAEIMKKYSNLINKVKTTYYARGYNSEDFETLAKVGIWKGIERFDERKLKYIYNKKTKTWRVCEQSFIRVFSSCLKNNVLRQTARVWRKEKKVKRKGEEQSYEVLFESGNLGDIEIADQPSDLYIDLERCFTGMNKAILSSLMAGYDIKEIATAMGCKRSFIKHSVIEIRRTIKQRGLITC